MNETRCEMCDPFHNRTDGHLDGCPDKPALLPGCCVRGCGQDALNHFVVCYEHVTKDALVLFIKTHYALSHRREIREAIRG